MEARAILTQRQELELATNDQYEFEYSFTYPTTVYKMDWDTGDIEKLWVEKSS
jgi:hypothetical protein